jgi:CheY-like chemotaxis protein
MKDEFLATLSHELRTPLTAILGWSQVLLSGWTSDAEMMQGLETIERNARAQTKLVEDLLDMSSIISGKLRLDMQRLTPLSFIEAAIETIQPAAEAKGVRLMRMLDANTGPIRGDANRLQQVVWNLLSNAIKFTPAGGTVELILERVDSHIEIAVTDTGQGISAEFLPYVFDRFRQADSTITRRYKGLGLGLAIVKQLVELHGGAVRVQSTGEGQGTTFVVTLPLAVSHERTDGLLPRDSASVSHSPLDSQTMDLSGLKILVVDDEPDACRLIKRVLDRCHAEVFTASSAEEAIPLVESGRPDILISDIGMPNMDGYDLLRRIRALDPARGGKVPAIALTAFARPEDRMRSLSVGYSVHVSKPIEPEKLTATVASLAGRTNRCDAPDPA